MYENLLPIGSVVLLRGAKTKLMIMGRILSNDAMEEIYDYVGCIYPLGMTGEDNNYFFNREDIEKVFFVGFQDEEELNFRSEVLAELGELEIKDGEIVPKE